MVSSADLRASERVPVNHRVKLVSKGRLVAYVMCINISMGGALLHSATPLPVGSQCKLAIPLPGADGLQRIVTDGTVVRSDTGGTAVQFSRILEKTNFEALTLPTAIGGPASLLAAYAAYFQVSRNEGLADCEQLLGVSKRTFRTSFYISFFTCIPLAVLLFWAFRASIPLVPNWVKILLSFIYGGIWLAIIQPSIDLTVFHFVRQKKSAQPNA